MSIWTSDDVREDVLGSKRPTAKLSLPGFVALRLLGSVVVIWAATTIGFFILRLVPGSDDVQTLVGAGGQVLTPAQIAAIRHTLGFDQPLLLQYGHYLLGILHGDLGTSYLQNQPVTAILAPQAGPTTILALAALVTAWILAIGWTLLTAGRPRTLDTTGRVVEITLFSLPQFWLGLILRSFFSIRLGWFPVLGEGGFGLVLPVLTLALPLAGLIGQLTRGSFEEAMAQPFILSARARGLSPYAARTRHALRHAIIPALAFSGQTIGWLLGGTLVIEQIFARRGIGQIIFQAVANRDLPVILGVVIFVATAYVVIGLVLDILYRVVDPRIEIR